MLPILDREEQLGARIDELKSQLADALWKLSESERSCNMILAARLREQQELQALRDALLGTYEMLMAEGFCHHAQRQFMMSVKALLEQSNE